MFQVPQAKVNEWKQLFNNHRALITGCDVYFNNMVMLNGRHKILDRGTFLEEYRGFTDDIECKTQPIDAFDPYVAPDEPEDAEAENEETAEEPKKAPLFVCNRETPEYKRIKNRVTMDQLKKTFNPTHKIMIALDKGEVTYDDIIDDIYIYYCFFKYVREIETIRLAAFSNYTEIIEYIVTNITYDDLKKFLQKDKIDEEKVAKHTEALFFEYDRKVVTEFYMDPPADLDGVPKFDLESLINRLVSNINLKSDIYMILGVYLTASFAMSDFKFAKTPEQIESSPCAKYVREVLAIL